MSLFQRLFRPKSDPRDPYRPLYAATVARARAPVWYLDGVPDTLDGRFDMLAALLSLVMIRLERDEEGRQPSVHLAELFVDDMDGQLRQIGIGDMIVGKHIGRMMAALGGRLGAYRDAGKDVEALRAALVRNLWQGDEPGGAAAAAAERMSAWAAALDATATDAILAGTLPELPQ
ncbi:MAG: ubiquinol-cytochrome C chaperone [Sphingopyxis sp.]|nr:ubiquinol-cytochrome C chaperone [Sphingopyxis sp.]